MKQQLLQLSLLLRAIDPELCDYLGKHILFVHMFLFFIYIQKHTQP